MNFLEKEGGNAAFFNLLRPHGFVADAGAEFYGSPKGIADAESLAFLFNDAKEGLAALHKAIPQIGRGVKDVPAPGLGEDSFGVSGTFALKLPPGYFYVWRVGDAALSFTMSGRPSVVTAGRVRSYAVKLAEELSN